jgi:hypothetical protein
MMSAYVVSSVVFGMFFGTFGERGGAFLEALPNLGDLKRWLLSSLSTLLSVSREMVGGESSARSYTKAESSNSAKPCGKRPRTHIDSPPLVPALHMQ